jgi:ankyrin repeat protein
MLQVEPVVQPTKEEEYNASRYVAKIPETELDRVDIDGDSLLHLFILKGMTAHIAAFLNRFKRHGRDVADIINKLNHDNQTPIYLATYTNQPSVVAKLVEYGADVYSQGYCKGGRSPLHYSVMQGDAFFQTTAQLLRSPNVQVDMKNDAGKTPLHCAIEVHKCLPKNKSGEIIESLQTIRLLVQHQAGLDVQDGNSGKTPLHYAVECKEPLKVLSLLFSLINPNQRVEFINKKNYDGQTCLHIAAGQSCWNPEEHIKLINLLLNNGADPNIRNSSRQTPKDLVTRTQPPQIVQMLIPKSSVRR